MASYPTNIGDTNISPEKPNIKGDKLNFLLLTFLYILQGSIIGIGEAIPIVLQKRNATYEDQAELNLMWHPFSFKILWAPIVDSIYWKRIGRRKSWMILTQYSIGALLFFVSMNVDDWLGSEEGTRKPNVRLLTVIFSLCTLFSSIQDIVVDGWSLTMFQKRNLAYSAICQSVGSSIGNIVTFTTFIVLGSKNFSNYFRSVPQDRGFVTFAEFLSFLSIVFVVTVTLILIFKKENDDADQALQKKGASNLTIMGTYVLLVKILKMQSIQLVGVFLLTRLISSAPTYTVAPLKLLDGGLSEDTLALLTIPFLPFQIFLPLLLNGRVTGSKPMHLFLIFYILRLVVGAIYTAFIFFISSSGAQSDSSRAWYFWPLLVFFYNFDNFALLIMAMAVAVVFARISDPRFGGVYMTLLNSINSIGESWSCTVCLWLVPLLTIKSCNIDSENKTCHTKIDGFFMEVVLCTLIGVVWICWGKKYIYKLEKMNAQTCLTEQEPDIVRIAKL